MDEGTRKVIVTIALVAAAIGPVLIIVGKVISVVGTIMTLVPKLASITVGYLDMETMNIVDMQMYIDGYQVKLVSDTSYGSLWEVSFTLKEF